MDSKQFANALCMQHVLRYDLTELQYLKHISSFALDGWLGQKFAAFPHFDDLSPQGPHLYCYDFGGVTLNPLQSLKLFVRYC